MRTPALAARFASEFNIPFSSLEDRCAVRSGPGLPATGRDATRARRGGQIVCCGTGAADIARRAAAVNREVDELRLNGLRVWTRY